nr:MAG TPA: hypothetical protein [Caudoviricetes sp.]
MIWGLRYNSSLAMEFVLLVNMISFRCSNFRKQAMP